MILTQCVRAGANTGAAAAAVLGGLGAHLCSGVLREDHEAQRAHRGGANGSTGTPARKFESMHRIYSDQNFENIMS